MTNILSQEEIDALLGAVQPEAGGETERAKGSNASPGDAIPYDFRRPNRVSKEQLRFFQTIHETFSRQFGNTLAGYLRSMVDIEILSADQLTYGEYVLSLPSSTALFVYSMSPLEGHGVLEVNPSLLLGVVERLFGGSGGESILNRDLTYIETAVMTRLVQQGLSALSSSWERVLPIKVELQELVKSPQMMQLLPNTETVILLTFELRTERLAGLLSVCYPFVSMEPLMPQISNRQALLGQNRRVVAEGPEWIGEHLGESWLPVTAQLGECDLTVAEFLRLRPGDVVRLDRKVDAPIDVLVGGERKGLARPGLKGRKRAIRLESLPSRGDEKHAA